MAKQFLQMGDQNTADVELHLHLLDEDGVEYEETDPMFLHSQVLTKSEFYEAKLSDRWTSHKKQLPIQIKVRTSHSADNYSKCLQLMYSSKRLSFSSVDEALDILPVACEMLFSDGIEQCMEYLDALPWTPVQEEKLRNLISSLGISILPHLAARLETSECKSDCRHLKTVKKNLQEMMSMMRDWPLDDRGGDGSIYIVAQKYIVDTINANPSSDIADICRFLIFGQFIDNIEVIKLSDHHFRTIYGEHRGSRINKACSVLLWLVDVFQRCDLQLFERVLKMFCEDDDLSHKLCFAVDQDRYSTQYKEGMIDILDITIGRFIKAVANAEIILPASYRASLITNWFYTLNEVVSYTSTEERFRGSLEEGMIAIAETLSYSEQETVFNVWKIFNPCKAIVWWNTKVSHAHRSTSSNESAP